MNGTNKDLEVLTNKFLEKKLSGKDAQNELVELKNMMKTPEGEKNVKDILAQKVKEGALTQEKMDELSQNIFDTRFDQLNTKVNANTEVREQEALETKLKDIQSKDIETLDIHENEWFCSDNDINHLQMDPVESDTESRVQAVYSNYQKDEQVWQIESETLMKGYTDFVEEIKKITEPKTVEGKVFDFTKSLVKVLTFPLYLPLRIAGIGGENQGEIKQLQEKCLRVKKTYAEKSKKLQEKKKKIEEHGKDLKQMGVILSQKKREGKNQQMKEIEDTNQIFQNKKKELNNKQDLFANNILYLRDVQKDLDLSNESAKEGYQKTKQEEKELFFKQQGLYDHQKAIEETLPILDGVLGSMPQDIPEFFELQKKRDSLLKIQEKTADANDFLSGENERIRKIQKKYDEKGQENLRKSTDIDEQEKNYNTSLSTLDESINLLDQVSLSTETKKLQIENECNVFRNNMERTGGYIKTFVDKMDIQNEEIIKNIQKTGKDVEQTEVKGSNIWDETYGGVAKGLGQGLNFLGKKILAMPTKLFSQGFDIVKETNIPVLSQLAAGLKFSSDVGTGVIEGATELVTGVTTIIEKPVETVKGMGALIGRNPVTGEWSVANGQQSWKNMGKAIVAYDDFEQGNIGLGIGKAMANLGSFLIPGSGAGSAAKLAWVSTKGIEEMSLASKIVIGGGRALSASTRVMGERMLTATRTMARISGRTLRTVPILGEHMPEALTMTTRAEQLSVNIERLKTAPFGAKSTLEFEKVFGKPAEEVLNSSEKIVINPEGMSAKDIAKAIKVEREINQIRRAQGMERMEGPDSPLSNEAEMSRRQAKKLNTKIEEGQKQIQELQKKIDQEKLRTENKKRFWQRGTNEKNVAEWEGQKTEIQKTIDVLRGEEDTELLKMHKIMAPQKIKEGTKAVQETEKELSRIQKEQKKLETSVKSKDIKKKTELATKEEAYQAALQMQKEDLAYWEGMNKGETISAPVTEEIGSKESIVDEVPKEGIVLENQEQPLISSEEGLSPASIDITKTSEGLKINGNVIEIDPYKIVDMAKKSPEGVRENYKTLKQASESVKDDTTKITEREQIKKTLADYKFAMEKENISRETKEANVVSFESAESVLNSAQEALSQGADIVAETQEAVASGKIIETKTFIKKLKSPLGRAKTEFEKYKILSQSPKLGKFGYILGGEKYYLSKLQDIGEFLIDTEKKQKKIVDAAWIGKLDEKFREGGEQLSKAA